MTRHSLQIALVLLTAVPAAALDDEHWKKANQTIGRGIEFLRSTQNNDGSWSPRPGPAVTALVVTAMLDHPQISADDPAVRRAINHLLARQRDDGGIYDQILPNYNTAICLSALSRVRDKPAVAAAIRKAEAFMRSLQWTDQTDPQGKRIDTTHPFFGGVGYGKHGRPDGSNTQIFVQALGDLGCDCDDPAMQNAVAFFTMLQGTEANRLLGEKIRPNGGAIYATSIDKDHIGVGQSMASPELIDEAKAGRSVSGLRTYGSMTYAMFKTYIYAQLPRDDPRVTDAVEWIRHNYTVAHNPGMPEKLKHHGYYYYLVTMARALGAWGTDLEDAKGQPIQWDTDLVNRLAHLQRPDGSWTNPADRWMEGDPNLVTTYALLALTETAR